MRRRLVERLACPACQRSLNIAEVITENSVRIMEGALVCTGCGRRYAIEHGVPRLVLDVPAPQAEVCRRYSFQWLGRWNGKFEGSRCYGFHDDEYIGWVNEQLQARRPALPDEWMLDCGCGSGEKTAALARLCPDQNVVGLDLGVASQEKAIDRFGDMPNLDYVQGDILHPPLQPRGFAYGMSLGVLHHTEDTRRALASFRRLLTEETSCVIWIYPPYREGPEWWLAYFARDWLLLGQGPRLPTGFLRFLSHAIVTAFYPVIDFTFKKSYRRIHRDLAFFDVERMTRQERYAAQVFFLFDTCLPYYQHRHPIEEVQKWLVEEGLEPTMHLHSFYGASSSPVSNRTRLTQAAAVT